MYLYSELQVKEKDGNQIRVCLIGAGKFGSMFLSQSVTTPGLEVARIVDLDPSRAKLTCKAVGWSDVKIDSVHFTDDALRAIRQDDSGCDSRGDGTPSCGCKAC